MAENKNILKYFYLRPCSAIFYNVFCVEYPRYVKLTG